MNIPGARVDMAPWIVINDMFATGSDVGMWLQASMQNGSICSQVPLSSLLIPC
jgi:hypothetical protein